ncbi:hypothetical protein COLO4_21973 [Corchorus olitorius]|uniref:Uncharacterized protein n=1 Tax=Corchorus olitorius TaxID=93759 RepID=A0A1R3IPS6_9ROSI|nr:hypothetical protein COLO4_21973 [Corchorus olitorius]
MEKADDTPCKTGQHLDCPSRRRLMMLQRAKRWFKTSGITVGSVSEDGSGPVNDFQTKIGRSERLGVPVQFSGQEKRLVLHPAQMDQKHLSNEELKMKARGELLMRRQKRKLVLQDLHHIPKLKVEEETRKTRAIRTFDYSLILLGVSRFSNSHLSFLPEVNGKGNIEALSP